MLGNSNQQPEHGHLTLERRLNSSFHCTIIWACSGVRKTDLNTCKDYRYTVLYTVHIHGDLPLCRKNNAHFKHPLGTKRDTYRDASQFLYFCFRTTFPLPLCWLITHWTWQSERENHFWLSTKYYQCFIFLQQKYELWWESLDPPKLVTFRPAIF